MLFVLRCNKKKTCKSKKKIRFRKSDFGSPNSFSETRWKKMQFCRAKKKYILICPCMAYIPGKYTHASKIENIREKGRNGGKNEKEGQVMWETWRYAWTDSILNLRYLSIYSICFSCVFVLSDGRLKTSSRRIMAWWLKCSITGCLPVYYALANNSCTIM